MHGLLLILIGIQLGVLLGLVVMVFWLRGVQEKTDIMLAAIHADLIHRENRLLMIATRLERVFKLRKVT